MHIVLDPNAHKVHILCMTLQEWMDLKSWRDERLAQELGGCLSRSQVSRIRRGKSKPTPETARELERVTKIPAAAFIFGDAA